MKEEASILLDAKVGDAFFGGFAGLRPVQEEAIRSLGGGRSVVISAGTGSGKTEAVIAPLVSRYRREAIREGRTVILYVCPTKALINDLARRLAPPLDRLGLKLSVRHGDQNDLETQQPDHVLLTTPESFAILLTQKHPALSAIRAVVLDEVHLLFNTQRGQMVAILLHRLKRAISEPIQIAAISATVSDLADLRDFLLGSHEKVDLLPFPRGRILDGDVRRVGNLRDVGDLVVRLMRPGRRKLLIFANSRRETEEIAGELKDRVELENLIYTHHSSLSPDVRERVEQGFAASPKAVCVSTSTLEMGIDIGDIDAVILYGPTHSIESLLQRVGRGNRRSNKTNAICLSRDGTRSVRESALFSTMLSLAADGGMPDKGPAQLYGAVTQQCLIKILENEGAYTMIRDIFEDVGYCESVQRPIIEAILAELAEKEFVQHHGFKNRYGAGDALWELRDKHLIWCNFPLGSQTIDLVSQGRIMGSIPRANLMRLTPGSVLRFGGARFRVIGSFDNQLRVEKAPGSGSETSLIFGTRGQGGIEAFLAQSLWTWLFQASAQNSFMASAEWERVWPFIEVIRGQVKEDDLPFTTTTAGYRYYTFGGVTVNRVALGFFGVQGEVDDLSIVVPSPLDWGRLPTTCAELGDVASRTFVPSDHQTIFQQALPIDLQRQEWLEGWLKDRDAQKVLCRLQKGHLQAVDSEPFDPLFT
jgi:ATP-dependent Lhr-like helicase